MFYYLSNSLTKNEKLIILRLSVKVAQPVRRPWSSRTADNIAAIEDS